MIDSRKMFYKKKALISKYHKINNVSILQKNTMTF